MIGFNGRQEQRLEEEHFGVVIEDFDEEAQVREERNVLQDAEDDGGNRNPDYRNENRSVFVELPHSSSEAWHSIVICHHQESLGNLIDAPQEAIRRTRENPADADSGSTSSCSRQDRNPRISEQYNASTTTRPDASTPPQNDPTQNDLVPENHLQICNNVEAHSSNAAGPSGCHSSSSPETQSNSRKRRRKSNFPSCSFDSPEMEVSPSKRRRPNSRLGWNNNPLSIRDEQYDASMMPCPYVCTPPQNDPTQNDSVPGNPLEAPNNAEAHNYNADGPSEGHSSSSLETQSNSRKRKRKGGFPSSSFNSPEMDGSPSKRRRSDSDEETSTMPRPDASTKPQNDPTRNDPIPGNHLEVSNNVEAHSSNLAGPSKGHNSSSLETQNNSRKRKRKSDFPSCSFNFLKDLRPQMVPKRTS
ncbi:hypothetical protein MHYP_G00127770 [Metynnis hypsauchen]